MFKKLTTPVVLLTVNPLSEPTDVILVCAAVVSVPATLVNVPFVPDTLPVDTLPVTVKLPRVPTDVKLEPITLLAKNVPVNVSALAEFATTPVN